ncbi:MAG: hypothetical protein M1838_002410 [Thelocarpon superellum]|nr:MAG: hypothetical protein M1838_002410 [Thelocarpon superellum]
MAASLKSLYRKVQPLFVPASSSSNPRDPNGFQKVAAASALFPTVDPAVDGPDCNKDCASCTIQYPARFRIDESDQLYGQVNGWTTHVLVATGKTDWVKHVVDEQGSVMEALGKGGVKPKNGDLMLSASNIPPPEEYYAASPGRQPTTVLVLPSFTLVDNVTPQDVPELISAFVDTGPTTTSPMIPSTGPNPAQEFENASGVAHDIASAAPALPRPSSDSNLTARRCPHQYLILLCSQKTRDVRCGQSAPLLRRELERHLRPLGLYRDLDDDRPGGVGIYFISHVGGHKYSANMMIYRKHDVGEASQAIWLARIRPEDCEAIVKYTVLQGKVVKPLTQLRGGFDRERGVVSW